MRSGPSVALFDGDDAGQSAVIGFVLILGLVVVGTGAVVVLGSDAISQTKQATELQRAEHGMTLLDSRSAQVALGSAPTQSVTFSSTGDGSFHAEPGGRIVVEHLNYSGSDDNETIYNSTLGAFVYENGETTIAYEGGGVWRTRDGGTQMISPPEFHYRDQTLTLPIIRVDGSGGAAGSATAHIVSTDRARHVFPNRTAGGGNGVGAPYDDGTTYDNPVTNGTVRVTVQSPHYRGWAKYFRTRTEGNVSVDPATHNASVVLSTISGVGAFDIVGEDGSISIQALESGHSVTDLSASFKKGQSANVQAFSFYAKSAGRKWQTIISAPDNLKKYCPDPGSQSDLQVEVYYRENTRPYHAWSNTSVSPDTGDIRIECDADDTPTLVASLTSDANLTYGSLAHPNKNQWWVYDTSGSPAAYANLTGHNADGEPTNYTASGPHTETSLDHLTNHYFAEMGPTFDLSYRWGNGNSPNAVDTGASEGTLDYEAGGAQYITFLHVTENDVRIRVR